MQLGQPIVVCSDSLHHITLTKHTHRDMHALILSLCCLRSSLHDVSGKPNQDLAPFPIETIFPLIEDVSF